VQLSVQRPEVANLRVSGIFRAGDSLSFARAVAQNYGLRIVEERRRIVLTRRVDVITPDPDNPNAILWNPATAPFDEAWARLGIDGGVAAGVGGTDTFGLFLTIGYAAYYLTKTEASVPSGRPVFAGVGTTTTAEEVMRKVGLVHKDTRMLDASVNCRVEEWVKG